MKKGWIETQLGEICEIYQPKTISRKEMQADGQYPVFGANGIIGRYSEYNHENPQLLITCRGATCGRVNVSLPKSWVTGNAMVVRPRKDELDIKYLEYFCRGGIDFSEVITGAAQPQITRQSLTPVAVSYPAISEQKRIVAILDEAFAGIETAIANTEKNLVNARELFESYADLAVRGLQGAHCYLEDCVEQVSTGPFGSLLHKSDYVSDGLPLVNPINIVDSRIVPDDRKCVAEDTLERLSAYVLKEGDVVVARRGEIGRCAVVEQEQDGWLCGTGCFFVRPTKDLNPHFLVNLLRSETGRSELLRRSTGATMKNLGNKALSTFEIRLPPREAQDKAIEQLSDLKNASHELTQVSRTKLRSLKELKQSLLQKAFSGELTADRGERDIAEISA